MTIQSVRTLVELGRPQATFRADRGRVLRAQILALCVALLLFVFFAAGGSYTARLQAAANNPEGQVIALWVGVIFSLGSLLMGVYLTARLQGEKRAHIILHDEGLYIVDQGREHILRWGDVKEIREVPATNVTLLMGGLSHYLFQLLLNGGASQRHALDLLASQTLLLPGHLENGGELVTAVTVQLKKSVGQEPLDNR